MAKDKATYLEVADAALSGITGGAPPEEAVIAALVGIGAALIAIAETMESIDNKLSDISKATARTAGFI